MADVATELTYIYPRCFHVARTDAIDRILKFGLFSVTALLDRAGVTGKTRESIECQRRESSIQIIDPQMGPVILRDQRPLTCSGLQRALRDGLTPRDWFKLLNRRVFFWFDLDRAERLVAAYPADTQSVLILDTSRLLASHKEGISLSPINSGSTAYVPQPRGQETFLPIEAYPLTDYRKKRGRRGAVAELTVDYAVQNASDYCIDVLHLS
jgi:hypothetical protein